MKNIITILLFFISLVGLGQISGKVEYEIEIGDDPRFLLHEGLTEIMRSGQTLSNDLTFNLYFKENQSYFEINNSPINYLYYVNLFMAASTDPECTCYSDLKDQIFSCVIYNRFLDEEFILEDKNDFQWEITNEEKEIQNLKVFKAIGKTRNNERIEAWFTPEIPVNAGPENFMGLPGLILELQVLYTKYICKKIEFTNAYDSKIVKATGKGIINYKNFDEQIQKQHNFLMNQ